jgi:hypothetical protein
VRAFCRPLGRSVRRSTVTRRWSARTAQADAPGTLADLELAEPRCAELCDQRGKQFVGQTVDRGVIRSAFGGVSLQAGIA